MVKQYCQGGLQIINCLKLTWLRRVILSNSPCQSVLKNINFQEIFTLGRESILSLIRNVKNKFWVDVLKAYADLQHLNHQDTENHVLSSPIFHNNEIKIGNKSVYIKSCYQNGVRYVNDIIHKNGEFFSQNEFENMYNIKTNFVQFLGLKQAIKVFAKNYKILHFTKN